MSEQKKKNYVTTNKSIKSSLSPPQNVDMMKDKEKNKEKKTENVVVYDSKPLQYLKLLNYTETKRLIERIKRKEDLLNIGSNHFYKG